MKLNKGEGYYEIQTYFCYFLLIFILCGCSVTNTVEGDPSFDTEETEQVSSQSSYIDNTLEGDPSFDTEETEQISSPSSYIDDVSDEFIKYSSKDGMRETLGSNFDTDTFWNIEGTSDAGFIMPIDRFCTDWELYCQVEQLINKHIDFRFALVTGDRAALDYEYDGSEYCPVNTEHFFNCKTMADFFEYYKTIYCGNIGFEGFVDLLDDDFTDVDGVLSIKYEFSQGEMGGFGFMRWGYQSIAIFDQTDDHARVIMAVPCEIPTEANKIESPTYFFYAMDVFKIGDEWRLSDNSYFTLF